ncbi:GMC family oxidoreductase N-terminal domain-containing protein [Mycobacterium sp. OTB74]|uniref:GMC family oxidoreductase N-terminal domain-containing protein n=1 Tax=Mycobacterium sp. OTB74 TaxID=1853452 RepID=UPI0024751D37|nr:GMC family oxidoreductase N-terminal domain-containing protein [Mycobacterium sp. OTB74]MDH6243791.1 choline dehydrogenase-like flavoprotein [Mycobacterium sp. OTB74]
MSASITATHREVLRALADTVVPAIERTDDPTGFWAISGTDLKVDAALEMALSAMPDAQRAGLLGLIDALHANGFVDATAEVREQIIDGVGLLGPQAAGAMNALVSLALAFGYAGPNPQTGSNPMWAGFGYPGALNIEPGGDGGFEAFVPDAPVIEADVCVVGSGAGGGLIAGILAGAGLDVVVLEAGGNHHEADFTGLELPAFQQLFWKGGPTPTADFNVTLLAGSTVGGGPTVNWSNCLRTPAHVRRQWADEFGLQGVDGPDFDRHLDAVSERLGVNPDCSDLNGPHQRMRDGAAELGWNFTKLRRNAAPEAYSADTAGYLGLGDRSGAKLDVRRTYLTDAVTAGARVIVRCTAQRVLTENDSAAGVSASFVDPTTGEATEVTVRAPRVVVSCGSLESPALLLRSGIGGPAVGQNLHLHPVVATLALHDEPQRGWWGAPMTAMVDEFADVEDGYGFLIQGVQWSNSLIAGGMSRSSNRELKETMAQLENAVWFVGIPRDRGCGRVSIDEAGNSVVTYDVTDEVDVRNEQRSIEAQIRLHAASGAREIVPFAGTALRWRKGDDLEEFIETMKNVPLGVGGHRVFSAHQMSSCRMGTDPQTSVANPVGELHDVAGVYIGDASALPTATGVNPMLSTMAMAHRTAEVIAQAAGVLGQDRALQPVAQ